MSWILRSVLMYHKNISHLSRGIGVSHSPLGQGYYNPPPLRLQHTCYTTHHTQPKTKPRVQESRGGYYHAWCSTWIPHFRLVIMLSCHNVTPRARGPRARHRPGSICPTTWQLSRYAKMEILRVTMDTQPHAYIAYKTHHNYPMWIRVSQATCMRKEYVKTKGCFSPNNTET